MPVDMTHNDNKGGARDLAVQRDFTFAIPTSSTDIAAKLFFIVPPTVTKIDPSIKRLRGMVVLLQNTTQQT